MAWLDHPNSRRLYSAGARRTSCFWTPSACFLVSTWFGSSCRNIFYAGRGYDAVVVYGCVVFTLVSSELYHCHRHNDYMTCTSFHILFPPFVLHGHARKMKKTLESEAAEIENLKKTGVICEICAQAGLNFRKKVLQSVEFFHRGRGFSSPITFSAWDH